MDEKISEGILLGLGHPLLDIIAPADQTLLSRYGLNANDSVRANETHTGLCRELTANPKCQYIAGGSVQNTLRTAQWILKQPYCATFMGAIGDDEYGRIMTKVISGQGVNFVAMVDQTTGTGTSACLISDKSRALVAYLGASQNIRIGHLLNNYNYVEKARYFYTSGYHVGIDPESIMNLAQHAHNAPGKLFCLNLSAPYISQKLSKPLLELYPYVDILFGNEAEVQAFATLNGWQTNDVKEMTRLAADMPSRRPTGRTVVITQGIDAVLVATTGHLEVREFPVPVVPESEIVDTIGAGDAFVGGYFAQLVRHRPVDACVRSGVYAAQQVIRQIGCQFPPEMLFKC